MNEYEPNGYGVYHVTASTLSFLTSYYYMLYCLHFLNISDELLPSLLLRVVDFFYISGMMFGNISQCNAQRKCRSWSKK